MSSHLIRFCLLKFRQSMDMYGMMASKYNCKFKNTKSAKMQILLKYIYVTPLPPAKIKVCMYSTCLKMTNFLPCSPTVPSCLAVRCFSCRFSCSNLLTCDWSSAMRSFTLPLSASSFNFCCLPDNNTTTQQMSHISISTYWTAVIKYNHSTEGQQLHVA